MNKRYGVVATFFIVYSAVFLSACSSKEKNAERSLPFFNTSDFTPEWIDSTCKNYDDIHQVANFSLLNQDGNKITQQDLLGKITVVNFFFTTCPGICPKLNTQMRLLQDSLPDDSFLLLSHSVMPEHDNVRVLNVYAESFGVKSGKWHLLTGDKDEIYTLARESYFADEDFIKTSKASEFIHTENVILLDDKLRIRGVYNGTIPLEIQRLIKHARRLKVQQIESKKN